MRPIVDGLENEYKEFIEFKRINAGNIEGREIFNAYSLIGHPAFLVLDEQGRIIWQSVGEQPGEEIESALQDALDNT